ncbi:MAG: 3-hydroxyacyl-ACP dehydratase FabZ [Bacillota bacterium]|nr:3-hydroxyacyl-ACP dehydratase FabZ [Bacillota bacterium]
MLLDRSQIEAILPHRDPFLLVDSISRMDENEVTGHFYVRPDLDVFRGHFPQEPVLPGVLIVEAIAQTGAVLVLSKPENRGRIAYFGRIDKVRFRRKVIPGDELELSLRLTRARGPVGSGVGEARVGGEVVAGCELTFVVGDAEEQA